MNRLHVLRSSTLHCCGSQPTLHLEVSHQSKPQIGCHEAAAPQPLRSHAAGLLARSDDRCWSSCRYAAAATTQRGSCRRALPCPTAAGAHAGRRLLPIVAYTGGTPLDWFVKTAGTFVKQQGANTSAPVKPIIPAPVVVQPAAEAPASKRDFLEARQVSIFSLFDGEEFKFDVPVYQRPYAWGTKQCYELLQDFLASYQAQSEYFLGAVVTTKQERGGYAVSACDLCTNALPQPASPDSLAPLLPMAWRERPPVVCPCCSAAL